MREGRLRRWALTGLVGLVAVASVAAACGDDETSDEPENFRGQTLTLVTHDSFNISESTIEAFETEHGVTVEVLETGDAVASLNRAILTKSNPEGDLLFGVDNAFFQRALREDLFVEYRSPELANVDDRWEFDDSGHITPIDYGYVLLNYDKAALAEAGMEPPATLEELTQPQWDGRVALEDPNTSSPGIQFMLATIGYFGEDGWLDWWADMRANDVIITAGWEDAYYTRFSQYGGEAWLVNSYTTSPPAEFIFAEEPIDEPPTGNVVIPNASYLQIEGVGILNNSDNQALAQRFIDFMLSETFQADIPLNMFVFPVRDGVALPEEFDRFADIPETVAAIDPERVASNFEDWLDAWTETVVR